MIEMIQLSHSKRLFLGMLAGVALLAQAPTTQVVPVKSNQVSAVATAKAREAYGEAHDTWKSTFPKLESNLTTYQDLDDLKKQVRDVRTAREIGRASCRER